MIDIAKIVLMIFGIGLAVYVVGVVASIFFVQWALKKLDDYFDQWD